VDGFRHELTAWIVKFSTFCSSLPPINRLYLPTRAEIMSPEAEAGPSRPAEVQAGEVPKNTGRKRKAGGDGKKGKIFLEDKVSFLTLLHSIVADDKAGLMSLMADVTGSKDTVVKSKLDNQRRRNDPLEMKQEETVAGPNKDKKKQRHEKKKADTRELVSLLAFS